MPFVSVVIPQFLFFMAKTRQKKEGELQKITEAVASAKSAVFANFQGLTMSDMNELRDKCREAGVSCFASKKTLVKIALREAGFDVDTKAFDGGVAAFFGTKDEVAPAQIVAGFAKNHEMVCIFGGILEGAFIDTAKVKALSTLPSKQELLAKMVGTLNAPVSGFVNVLAGNMRGLMNVLNAIKEQKA